MSMRPVKAIRGGGGNIVGSQGLSYIEPLAASRR